MTNEVRWNVLQGLIMVKMMRGGVTMVLLMYEDEYVEQATD